jgi:hypothetical protein
MTTMPPRSGWLGIAELLTPKRPPTPLENMAIAEVHELALRFADGACSLAEIKAATSAKQRHLATRYTTPKHPAWTLLLLLLDALIAESSDVLVTTQGTYLLGDLIAAGMRIVRADGHDIIQLPRAWPWRTKPNPDLGISGIHAEPVYRSLADRGPSYGSFGQPQAAAVKTAQPDWWEGPSTEEIPF